ncbi:hypothetical protein [Sphaerisporangium sp. NPDC051011]|uniref:hypothetical protein n=1 Tax=Sphaerisporangium sp. NPDC051011 TaxID=3155792 RepID=UPI0033C03761
MSAVRPVAPRRWSRPLAMLAALPGVLALGALFVVPPGRAVVKGDAFMTAQTTGLLNIEAGECFDDPVYSPAAGEKIVLYKPCPERADNQAYGFVHAADGPWDRAGLAAFAWKNCAQGFAHYWPGEAGAGLNYYPVMPTAETWADGDRDVMCVVYSPQGKLTRSLLPLK